MVQQHVVYLRGQISYGRESIVNLRLENSRLTTENETLAEESKQPVVIKKWCRLVTNGLLQN